LRLVLQTRLQVDAVGPDVDVALGRQVALAALLVFVDPDVLQPRAMVVADKPKASLPSKAASAAPKSPVDTPFR
jgi:hypothetical protein